MREIPLSRGAVAIVDDEDFERINSHKWSLHSQGYAHRVIGRHGVQRCVLMHREVLNDTVSARVDHRDRNRLNNTRGNLRPCTNSQNLANAGRRSHKRSSSFKGVFPARNSIGRPWRAMIKVNYKSYHLGVFASEIEGARAYDAAAILHFGEFARLNFPDISPDGGPRQHALGISA